MHDWNWNDDYSQAWCETDDPRILAVIERDNDGDSAPDGDAYAPACFVDYRNGWELKSAGSVGMTGDPFIDDIAAAYATARDYFGDHDKALRYIRIFHEVNGAALVSSTVYQGGSEVIIFDTAAHRRHVGCPADYPSEEFLRGDIETWQAYLDGEVYGIGYAVNRERVDITEDVDLIDFDVQIEVWGFYGEESAKESALEYLPTLDQALLPLN